MKKYISRAVFLPLLIIIMILTSVLPVLAAEDGLLPDSDLIEQPDGSEIETEEYPTVRFTDITTTAYYTEAVAWAVAKGVTSGTTSTTFSPDKTCTRSQAVTFLWRAAGQPEPESIGNSFTDVNENAYYFKAIMWAWEQGITSGKSDTTFGPDGVCSRAEIVTFLWRAAGQPKPESTDTEFTDVKENDYFCNAVFWAVEKGITYGISKNVFSPGSSCTRAQIAAFLFRNMGDKRYKQKLPILLYHHLTEEPSNTVDAVQFAEHMNALQEAGYTPVSIQAVEDYVMKGTDFPEKPVLITFDDGYTSNYEIAWPVLKEHGFPAVIFMIGCSIGKDTYKDTGVHMYPHFTMEQAEEMTADGLITIASHGYNIHEVSGRDPFPIREGIRQKQGETDEEYEAFLREDCAIMRGILGDNAAYFAFPYGMYSGKAEKILLEEGTRVTMTTVKKTSVLIRGMPKSLLKMSRYTIQNDISAEDLIEMIK